MVRHSRVSKWTQVPPVTGQKERKITNLKMKKHLDSGATKQVGLRLRSNLQALRFFCIF